MIRKTLAFATIAVSLVFGAMSAHAGSVRTGQFTGASDHVTSGGVTVSKDAQGYVVTLGPKFFLDGAPDPKVGFGVNGTYVDGTLIGVLQSKTGEQSYRVPASLNVSDFTDVFIWCEKFSVPLGVAAIN